MAQKVENLRQDLTMHDIEVPTEVLFVPSPEGESKSTVNASALQLLWDERLRLLRVAAWSLTISALVAFFLPNSYESSVSIMPPDSMNDDETMFAGLAAKASPELSTMTGSLVMMKSTGALFVDLFRSRSVQDRVVQRLDLQKVYSSRYKEDARKRLNSLTAATEDRKSGVITLTVEDRNPERAHQIAQAYVEELNHLVSEVSTSSAGRERIFIEERLATAKSDLEDAEKQFGAFASKHSTLDIQEQSRAMLESAAVLRGQIIASQSELQSLDQTYTSSNVRVRSLQARLDEQKRQLLKLEGTDRSLVSDSAQSNETYPPIRKLPLLGVEWADLYRRVKIQETVYELLSQQYEVVRIHEAKETATVNIIDPANVPEKKSSPHRLLIIVLLTVLSVGGAVIGILGSARIQSLELNDPRRQLAVGIFEVWNRLCERILKSGFRNRISVGGAYSDGP
jgi:uncharacterized protein involved in exopolysaccharide biosynthesis